MDNEKRKLAVAGCEEGKSLNGILDDVAWSLECLQVSKYIQVNVQVSLNRHTSTPWWFFGDFHSAQGTMVQPQVSANILLESDVPSPVASSV